MLEQRIEQHFIDSADLKYQASQLLSKPIAAAVQAILASVTSGGKVLACGNGGSAADAQHFAAEFVGRYERERPELAAIALTTDSSILTAIANDYGYDEIFLLQLKYQLRSGDVVVGISASGNSPNVVKAIEFANENGAHTVGLSGFDGGRLRQLVKTSLHVQTEKGEYGPVEDVHMVLDHLVGGFLMQVCRAETTTGVSRR